MSKKIFSILFFIVGAAAMTGCGRIAEEVGGVFGRELTKKAFSSVPSNDEKQALFSSMESHLRNEFGAFPRRIDEGTVLETLSFDKSNYTISVGKRIELIKAEIDHQKLRSYFQKIGEIYCQKSSKNFNFDTSWLVFHETLVDINGLMVGGVITRGLSKDCQIDIQIAP